MKPRTAPVLAAAWLVWGLNGLALADYDIPWHVFGAGGGWSIGGAYELTGTMGHANAADSTSAEYELGAGFWRNGALCSSPASAPALTLRHTGTDLELSWSAVAGATRYDVIRGDLAQLRSSAGDFTTATIACVANDTASTSVVEPAGAGPTYFLVRPAACSVGSYDSAGDSQAGARDDEVNAAVSTCP